VLDETFDIPEDKLGPPPAVADYLLGCVCFGEGHHAQALEHLLRAEQAEPRLNHLHNQIGAVYLKQLRWADAERAYRKALAIDGESAVAHDGLAQAYLGQERYDEAADEALSAVGIIHQFPEAHFHLGLALAKGRRDNRARLAFRTCLSMRPAHKEAREWLDRIKPITTPHEAARLAE
jgi:tetratricopeptide (TPR) repeat protein